MHFALQLLGNRLRERIVKRTRWAGMGRTGPGRDAESAAAIDAQFVDLPSIGGSAGKIPVRFRDGKIITATI